MLSGVNCGQYWYFGAADSFGILALLQALIVDNFGVFNTLGKNKHHPVFEPMTSHQFSLLATNSLRLLFIKRDKTCDTGDVRQETCDMRSETGDLRQETGDRRQETGDVRQET